MKPQGISVQGVGILALVVQLAFVLTFSATCAEITPVDLLERWQDTQRRMQQRVVRSVTLESYVSHRTDERVWKRREAEYRTDGPRLDLIQTLWPVTGDGQPIQEPAPPNRKQYIWNGSEWYDVRRVPEHPEANLVRVGEGKHRRDDFEVNAMPGGPLFGFFPGNARPLAKVLEDASRLQLREEREVVGGVQCFVVEAVCPEGLHTLWLDPEHGYNICRAEVQKGGEDIYYDKPLATPPSEESLRFRQQSLRRSPELAPLSWTKTKFTFILENVRFLNVDGVWIPIAGEWVRAETFDDGRTEKATCSYTASDVAVSPDFAAMQAFVPDVPDGTRVQLLDKPNILPLQWKNGKVDTVANETILEEIDKQVANLTQGPEAPAELLVNAQAGQVPTEQEPKPNAVTPKPFPIWLLIALVFVVAAGTSVFVYARRSRRT